MTYLWDGLMREIASMSVSHHCGRTGMLVTSSESTSSYEVESCRVPMSWRDGNHVCLHEVVSFL